MIAIETKDLSEVEAQKFLADIGPFSLARGAFPEFAWTPGEGFLRAGFWPFNFLPGVKTHRYPDRIRVDDAKPPVITVEGHGNVTFLALANRGREPVGGFELERAVREIARRVGVPFPAPKAATAPGVSPAPSNIAEPAPDLAGQAAPTSRLRLNQIKMGPRHRQDMGDLAALAESIRVEGLLQPIGVDEQKQLVFGERRLRACRDILGWTEIDVRVVRVSSLVAGEYAENAVRKDFTPSERVAIAKAIEAEIGKRSGQRTDLQPVGNCPQVEPGTKTRDLAAERAGFESTDEYRRAKKVVETGAPELVAAMDSGAVAVSTAAAIASAPKEEQRVLLATGKQAVAEAAAAKRAKKKRQHQSDRAKGCGRTPSLAPIGTLSPQEELVQLKESLSSLWDRLPGEDERKELLGVVRKFYEKHAESAVNPAA